MSKRLTGTLASALGTFLTMVALVCAPPQVVAKMYKWVDADGNTHYTQTPPPKGAQAGEQMKVKTGSVVKVRKRGKHYYCGDQRLPKVHKRPAIAISNLQNNILGWEERIINTKEKKAKYIKRDARSATKARFNRRLREYDQSVARSECKIKWGKEKLAALQDDKASIVKHHDDLKKLQQQVQARKVAACGTDDRTGVVVVDDAYREYKRCIRPFDRELRKLKGKVRRAGRDAELVSED